MEDVLLVCPPNYNVVDSRFTLFSGLPGHIIMPFCFYHILPPLLMLAQENRPPVPSLR